MHTILIQIPIIVILSFLVFYPTFSLALFGDDWLAFFRFEQHVDPGSGQWNILTYFLTPYGAQDIIMGLLNKVYGLNSSLYYLTSLLLRILAAFSIMPLVYFLTKNKLSAFFSALFFSVTVVGLDSTNWVFNMPTYIAISFFLLSLYFFVSSRKKGVVILLISGALYYLAYITAPIRMHGSLSLFFLLDLFWLLQEKDTKALKKVLFRLGIIILVFLIVRYTGHSQGPAQEATERFQIGIRTILEMLNTGRFDFLFYPIIMFGSTIIPDFILPSFQIFSKSQLVLKILLTPFLIFMLASFMILKISSRWSQVHFYRISGGGLILIIIILFTFSLNPQTFSESRNLFLATIGGLGTIFIAYMIFLFKNEKNISYGLFLGLAWSFLSFFFAWWWVPNSIFPTTYRYLIVSVVGLSILLGIIMSIGKNKSFLVFSVGILILVTHIVSSKIYISQLLKTHSQEISDKIWSSLPRVDEIGKSKKPVIFYFEGDNTNSAILHDTITFGFPPHMALEYNLREEDGGLPVPMSDFNEVVVAMITGETMTAYGYKPEPVDIERIYGFHLQGSSNLINITKEIRIRLSEIQLKDQQIIK